MKGWWRRIRAALGMGLIWAGGGASVGGLIELVSNLFPALPLYFVDMWIQTLAIPGFVGGVVFSAVLRMAARGRSFDELSYPRITAWGAGSGVLLGALFMGLGAGPLILVPAVVLNTLGASLTLAFGRMAEGWGGRGSTPDADELDGIGERKRLDQAG